VIDIAWEIILVLACVAFVAGFIDAIAGGGGLLTVPALLLAGLDPVSALATNKLQAVFGSGSATLVFLRKGYLNWSILPWVIASGAGSAIGVGLLPYVPRDALQVVLPMALVLVAGYFAFTPNLGRIQSSGGSTKRWWKLLIPVVGLYDGMFGPGTGSFFMLVFVSLGQLGLLEATARTKAANFASNLAALAAFAIAGGIHVAVGVAMAVGQLSGAWLGAHTSIRSGGVWIRPAVVTMSILLAGKLLWDAVGR
jgi:uncharacterized membrane protein YfcA